MAVSVALSRPKMPICPPLRELLAEAEELPWTAGLAAQLRAALTEPIDSLTNWRYCRAHTALCVALGYRDPEPGMKQMENACRRGHQDFYYDEIGCCQCRVCVGENTHIVRPWNE